MSGLPRCVPIGRMHKHQHRQCEMVQGMSVLLLEYSVCCMTFRNQDLRAGSYQRHSVHRKMGERTLDGQLEVSRRWIIQGKVIRY